MARKQSKRMPPRAKQPGGAAYPDDLVNENPSEEVASVVRKKPLHPNPAWILRIQFSIYLLVCPPYLIRSIKGYSFRDEAQLFLKNDKNNLPCAFSTRPFLWKFYTGQRSRESF